MNERLTITKGDITLLAVDAIVNAANASLLGGGGVDGAIHRAAGPELKAYNAKLGGCETGEAKISPGFNLPAKHVISTVGPVWQDGEHGEPTTLAKCYLNSLKLAVQHKLKTVAFPAISTGIYGFPFERATKIAIQTILSFLEENDSIKQVQLVFFTDSDYRTASEIKEVLTNMP